MICPLLYKEKKSEIQQPRNNSFLKQVYTEYTYVYQRFLCLKPTYNSHPATVGEVSAEHCCSLSDHRQDTGGELMGWEDSEPTPTLCWRTVTMSEWNRTGLSFRLNLIWCIQYLPYYFPPFLHVLLVFFKNHCYARSQGAFCSDRKTDRHEQLIMRVIQTYGLEMFRCSKRRWLYAKIASRQETRGGGALLLP